MVRAKSRAYFLIGADNEDIIQEGMIGLYKAVRDYNEEKNASFHSFAELCVNRQMITAIKAATRQKHQPLNSYVSLNKPVYEEELSRPIWIFCRVVPCSIGGSPDWAGKIKSFLEDQMMKSSAALKPECFVLYLQGRSYFEIAHVLDKPENPLITPFSASRKN